MRVLVTGGAGYIGSHTSVELLGEGFEVFIVDNFENSSLTNLKRIEQISNKSFEYAVCDICDLAALDKVFGQFNPDVVVHAAGLKSVNDSVSNAFTYYYVNVYGTINLLKIMKKWGCKKIVFSSSATVYGIPTFLPFTEKHPIAPINPYGVSKFYAEEIIKGWCSEYVDNSAIALRFFNPVGAHPSGLIGENPKNTPTNLMPIISKVATGQKDALEIYGNDYNTRDGSGERDFIHVMDIARHHIDSIIKLNTIKSFEVYNLGTGKGTTVFELIHEFEVSTGKKIKFVISPRREGDVASSWSNAQKAKNELGVKINYDLRDMCKDSWNWVSKNIKDNKKNR